MPSPRSSRSSGRQAGPSVDALMVAVLFGVLVAMATYAELSRRSIASGAELTRVRIDAPAGAQLDACRSQPGDRTERLGCYDAALGVVLERGELGATLRATNEYARTDPWFSARCHMLLHERGRAYAGVVDASNIEHDGKDCAAGFLHGWMLSSLEGAGTLDGATVRAWCSGDRAPLEHADCEHGIGHVLVRNLRGDLPTALVRCTELGDAAFASNCASGAFMENRFGGQLRDGAFASGSWAEGDPWRPCRGGRVPAALLDECAAWSARDVAPAQRLAWCDAIGRRGIDATACRIAVGVAADTDTPAAAACGDEADCWYGRGYAWAMLAGPGPSASRCSDTGDITLARACARGVGFRRAAAHRGTDGSAAGEACSGALAPELEPACVEGALQRHAPIAYA